MIDCVQFMLIMERSPQRGRLPRKADVPMLVKASHTVPAEVRAKYDRLYPREETELDRILGRDS